MVNSGGDVNLSPLYLSLSLNRDSHLSAPLQKFEKKRKTRSEISPKTLQLLQIEDTNDPTLEDDSISNAVSQQRSRPRHEGVLSANDQEAFPGRKHDEGLRWLTQAVRQTEGPMPLPRRCKGSPCLYVVKLRSRIEDKL